MSGGRGIYRVFLISVGGPVECPLNICCYSNSYGIIIAAGVFGGDKRIITKSFCTLKSSNAGVQKSAVSVGHTPALYRDLYLLCKYVPVPVELLLSS